MASDARRLIVNADDFGRSRSINEAVFRSHTEGILTTASLMVNEVACAEAVEFSKTHPQLGVGLHLTLLCGKSALPHHAAPDLTDAAGQFTDAPALAGMRYFFRPQLREQLRREIHEQFARFRATGLVLDHVNGHLHTHLHPVVLSILLEDAKALGIARMRLTADPLLLNLRLASGTLAYRLSHAFIFGMLARRARPKLKQAGIRCCDRVFGLLQNARVDEAFVLRLLKALPQGDSELYSHPCVKDFNLEYEALISPRVRACVQARGIRLIRYQDLQP